MTKNPTLGKVKTRLAKTIGDERALEIYIKLLEHTKSITKDLSSDKKVFYTDFIPEDDFWNSYQKYLQIEGDLGKKMENAFLQAFEEGYKKVLIIGGDCADLTEMMIKRAFDALDKAPIVIGPAQDGGYYLLAMTQMIDEIFENKAWSTDQVLSETLKDLEKLKISRVLLPILNDVDEWEDLPEDWR
jgi:hypothetical protein